MVDPRNANGPSRDSPKLVFFCLCSVEGKHFKFSKGHGIKYGILSAWKGFADAVDTGHADTVERFFGVGADVRGKDYVRELI